MVLTENVLGGRLELHLESRRSQHRLFMDTSRRGDGYIYTSVINHRHLTGVSCPRSHRMNVGNAELLLLLVLGHGTASEEPAVPPAASGLVAPARSKVIIV